MATATYTVAVDWDGDGDFDTLAEDISRDVLRAEWALGLDDPAESVAAPSWAAIVLRDPTRRYTPEYAAGPLYGALVPRQKVQITARYAGETVVLFTGWTESFAPGPDWTTTIRCSGVEALLQRAEVFLPLLTAARADEVIAAALAQVAYPPAFSGYWVLGRSRLGLDTRLPGVSTFASLEAGRSSFDYLNDNWRDGASAWAVIRAVSEAEQGLCFIDRSGQLVFWNRHHLLDVRTSALTLTGQEAEFTVVHGAAVVNHATVTCHPRSVGSTPATLWTLETPLRIPAYSARTVRARFNDDSGARVGGQDVITPLAGTDFTANSQANGTGTDLSGSVSASSTAAGGSAVLTYHNTGGVAGYVLAGAQLRGTRISDFGLADAEYSDAASITAYGRRARTLNIPAISDLEEGERLARWIVALGKAPRGLVAQATLHGETNATLRAAILQRTIGDRLSLDGARSDHRADYHLLGEHHTLTRGGTQHEVVWTLRPAVESTFWRLGSARLGVDTRLSY